MKTTMAEVIAERRRCRPDRCSWRNAWPRARKHVEYDVTITDSLTNSRHKPRYPARNMLKVTDLSGARATTTGTRARRGRTTCRCSARTCGARPPAASTVADPRVADQRRPGYRSRRLWEDRETFQSFIDYRLIVRLGTAENDTIIRGEGGLLNMPELGRMTDRGEYVSPNPAGLQRGRADGRHR